MPVEINAYPTQKVRTEASSEPPRASSPNLLSEQGDLVGARLLFERALAIYEKMPGPEHPNTATNRTKGLLVVYPGGITQPAGDAIPFGFIGISEIARSLP